MSVSIRLKNIMERKGIKPVDLARDSGVGEPRISQILSGGTKNPRVDTLKKLSDALKVSLSELTEDVVADTTTIIQSTGGAVTSGSAPVVPTSVIVQGIVAEVSHLSEADQLRLWAELRDRRDAATTPESDEKVLRGGGG